MMLKNGLATQIRAMTGCECLELLRYLPRKVINRSKGQRALGHITRKRDLKCQASIALQGRSFSRTKKLLRIAKRIMSCRRNLSSWWKRTCSVILLGERPTDPPQTNLAEVLRWEPTPSRLSQCAKGTRSILWTPPYRATKPLLKLTSNLRKHEKRLSSYGSSIDGTFRVKA